MHPLKQIALTGKGQIQVLKSRSELAVTGSDTTNARPLEKKETKSETATSKIPCPNDIPSQLERFARQHQFVVESTEVPFPNSDPPFVHWICFQGAYISDPFHDPFFVDCFDSKDEALRVCEESKVESPLLLFLWEEQISRLVDRVGFDLPDHDVGNDARTPDADSSNWGTILHRSGLGYLVGTNSGMWILFSSNDGASVTLALALARIV